MMSPIQDVSEKHYFFFYHDWNVEYYWNVKEGIHITSYIYGCIACVVDFTKDLDHKV